MAKEVAKVAKQFIVQRTYEVVVDAFSRDEAISMVDRKFGIPDGAYIGEQVGVKCGTPKQMKRA